MQFPKRHIYRSATPAKLEASNYLDLHPIAKLVLANRATKASTDPATIIGASLAQLDDPHTLPDVQVAADRIVQAIIDVEVIGLETDHDVDGVTSHAVLYRALVDHFGVQPSQIRSYIGHRLEEGYGLSDKLCDRILADTLRPTLIITADNGSSDQDRIARLKEHCIDTIVTDHHGMPLEGPPAAALACVSPARADSEYPDPLIAGVMVTFLLMVVVRTRLIEIGLLPESAPSLSGLLDYVAVGTVADCVSLARSTNNRAVIKAGLRQLNQLGRPCWVAIRPLLGDEMKQLTATDIGFGIGPRINAVGRLDDAMIGVRFLLAETAEEALHWVDELDTGNALRKEIEAGLKDEAVRVGADQAEAECSVIQVMLTDGHAGVHGIVASRLVETYGRPAICFSDKLGEPGVVTGSARGVEGMHVRKALQAVADQNPTILMKFGGHEGAAGLTLRADNLRPFMAAYEQAVTDQLGGLIPGPHILVDQLIDTKEITPALINGLSQLEPYGREFEHPIFEADFTLRTLKPVGQGGLHWKLELDGQQGGLFNAIWFFAETDQDLHPGGNYRFAFSIEFNWWRGKANLQLIIKSIQGTI